MSGVSTVWSPGVKTRASSAAGRRATLGPPSRTQRATASAVRSSSTARSRTGRARRACTRPRCGATRFFGIERAPTGGTRADQMSGAVPGGHYVTPAIVDMPAQTDIVKAETFAPLLHVLTYRDLEEAIAAGATHVRVGSAILGPRPVIQ